MRVGLIGTKLMARRRAAALENFQDDALTFVCGSTPSSGKGFLNALRARGAGRDAEALSGWPDLVKRPGVDAVIVCTPPHLHEKICLEALRNGKHVLCEKPLTRTREEARRLLEGAGSAKKVLKCGFNHRYHKSVLQAKEWLAHGRIGSITHVRSRYGICGRPGYEKEWRFDPKRVSGGHLMEHGIHLLDLLRFFLGDIAEVFAWTGAHYWKVKPFEDNAFLLLSSRTGVPVSVHSSLTQWRNLFSLELFGTDGMILLEGLGGSYGAETASIVPRAWHGPFREETVEFRGEDVSWKEEWREFRAAALHGTACQGTGEDGLAALEIVLAAYESSKRNTPVRLPSS